MQRSGDQHVAANGEMNAELEVELSAVDLLSLTPIAADKDGPAPAPSHAKPASANTSAAPAAPLKTKGHKWLRATAAAAAVVVGAIAIVSLARLTPERETAHPGSNWSPMPDPNALAAEEELAPPTLAANPFDPAEVFELPPGISDEEARRMVAELLLERANERQIYSTTQRR